MEQRLREIFNLERIKKFAEENIDQTEWIEEEFGEKRRILVIDTLFDSALGVYIPSMVLKLFRVEGYNLEDSTIYDALEYVEDEINECLNELLPSRGRYYVGYHECDGSYCLFYEEYECEEEKK